MTEKQEKRLPTREAEQLQYPQGVKWTKQRKTVYRILWEATEPLSAARIYTLAGLEADDGEYALSTIYRILSVFEENGYVEKSSWLGDGTVVYSLNRGKHTHYAICLECHRRIPLQNCPFAHIRLEKDTGDFTVVSHKLELYGYCRECREEHSHPQKNESDF